tara:strand:- start:175 stop:558 length:384 start_codon:yes stop_codon:yes gene_type:complete
MTKLDDTLNNYIQQTNLLMEQTPPPPADAGIPAPPAPGGELPGAAAVPAVPAGDPAATGGEKGETETMTDQGYVVAVQDMLELLSINPQDIEESDLDIFSDRVNPRNAMRLHEKLQDLIERYGSPTA